MDKDLNVRATAANGTVRLAAAVTTQMVRKAKEIHSLSPTASAALGRTLTGAALMSTTLKEKSHSITIQIKGNGPLRSIVVITDAFANVRGYVANPNADLPLNEKGKLDVGKAVGKGFINVIKDLGLKKPYIGQVDLVSGEIAEDLAYYYANSEQIPTVIALGVLVDKDGSILNSGGYMIQLMPDANDDLIDYVENKIQTVKPVTSMLAEGLGAEDILYLLLGEKGVKVLEKTEPAYKCTCSRDRMERNILSLGEKELRNLLSEQETIETQCYFCNSKYLFTRDDIEKYI